MSVVLPSRTPGKNSKRDVEIRLAELRWEEYRVGRLTDWTGLAQLWLKKDYGAALALIERCERELIEYEKEMRS